MSREEAGSSGSEAPVDPAFRADVLAGFSLPRKAVPARWFYDRAGSDLFEAITDLPEYTPTRSETALLGAHADAVAERVGPNARVVELGSGSSTKTPTLLRALAPASYVPVDISGAMLRASAARVAAAFPAIRVEPIEADFLGDWRLPAGDGRGPVLGFFPGSTIGNFTPRVATDLLRGLARQLGEAAAGRDVPWLLIGIDTVKDRAMLEAAYDDAAGVTAAFNRNLAARINRELGGTIPLDALAHRAVWNADASRVEMHLVAARAITFTIAGHAFAMAEGETIHTENSHKYTPEAARLLLAAGGWNTDAQWIEDTPGFQLLLARALPDAFAP